MNIKQTNKTKAILLVAAIVAISCAIYFIFIFKPDNIKAPKPTISPKKEFRLPDNRPEEIIGKKITLRRIEEKYISDFHKILSPSVTKPLYFPKNPTYFWVKSFLITTLKKEFAGQLFFYLIFDNETDKVIGFIDIREIDQNGQFGCGIHENYWRKGIFKEAVKLITQEYFKIKDKPSFIAHVEMWNLRSFYALKNVGFELDQFYYENGKPTRYILKFNNPKYKNLNTPTKKAQKQQ